MSIIIPKVKSTVHSQINWLPSNIDNFFKEIDHIQKWGKNNDSLLLYRGQSNYKWPIESTFVRNLIHKLFPVDNYCDLPIEIRYSLEFHRLVLSCIALNFGICCKPSEKLFELERKEGIDPWFEFLKNLQQYEEKYADKDNFIPGTFIIDWSRVFEVGLYFSVFSGRGKQRTITDFPSSLWLLNATSTGKIHQSKKLFEIMQLMKSDYLSNNPKNLPLMFHPPKQIDQKRPINQKPIYMSQMDYRYDQSQVWFDHGENNNVTTIINLVMSEEIKFKLSEYLEKNDITETFIYPD